MSIKHTGSFYAECDRCGHTTGTLPNAVWANRNDLVTWLGQNKWQGVPSGLLCPRCAQDVRNSV